MADDKSKKAVTDEPKPAEEQSSSTLTTIAEETKETPTDQSAEAFAKMRNEIKDLKDQLLARENLSTTFERPQPPVSPQWTQPNQQVNPQQFVDPVTGEFNAQGYSDAVNRAISNVQQNVTSFTQNYVNEQVDWALARSRFPELDTNQEFAEDVWGQFLVERGKNPAVSPVDVVQKVRDRMDKLVKREEAKVDKQAEVAISQKEVATAESQAQAPSVGANLASEEQEEDEEILRWKTRGVLPQSSGIGPGGVPMKTKVSKDVQDAAIVERLKKKAWHKAPEETAT